MASKSLVNRGGSESLTEREQRRAEIAVALETLRKWPRIDYHDSAQVEKRLDEYWQFILGTGLLPTDESLATALGVTARAIRYWKTGERKTDPEIIEMLERSRDYSIMVLQNMGAYNIINTLQGLSSQHALGVQDNPDKVVQTVVSDEYTQTAQDIMMKYQDMPDD